MGAVTAVGVVAGTYAVLFCAAGLPQPESRESTMVSTSSRLVAFFIDGSSLFGFFYDIGNAGECKNFPYFGNEKQRPSVAAQVIPD